MKIAVINMLTASDRMAFMAGQLDGMGLGYERFEAITPDTLDPPTDAAFWTRWERPMRPVEKALYKSHQCLWQRVVDTGEPHLILEDDAVLSPSLAPLLDQLSGLSDVDHVSFETRGRTKALGPRHPTLPLRRLLLDRSGAAAYALWPSGARRVLSHPAGLADAVLCAQDDWQSWQAVPALALQADQCEAFGLAEPISTTSNTGASPRPRASGLQALHYRARRIRSQVRMGLRQMRASDREVIRPAPDILT